MSNLNYDLVSALYHYAQSIDKYQRFLKDAVAEGDQELIELFKQVCSENENIARRLEQALVMRVQAGKFE